MSLAKSSSLFAAGTLLSRIAGLVRDRVVLAAFGSSELMNAFVIAFRIPNMLRELLAEGALGSSFTKVYSALSVEDARRAERLLLETMLLMTLVSIIVCTLGIVAAPWIVELTTLNAERAGHSPEFVQTTVALTRLLFPFLGFMVLGAVAMGALHQHGRFFLTSTSSLAFNVFNIIGALWFVDLARRYAPSWVESTIAEPGITAFTIFVLLGGLAQTLLQVAGVWGRLRAAWKDWPLRFPWSGELRKVLALMAPMVLAASAGQVNVLVNTIFATGIGGGAVVWLNSAFRLLHFPIGVFGVAIGAAVLPALSRAMSKAGGRVDSVASGEIQNAFELVLWLMAPCFAFYLINSVDIVRFLFESGRFTEADSVATGAALFAYSFALLSYGLMKVLTSFYFALERTRFALKVSLLSIGVNAGVNYLLVHEYGHVGLAGGYSVTLSVSVLLLILGLRGEGIAIDKRRLARSIGALAMAGGLALFFQSHVARWLHGWTWLMDAPLWGSTGLVLSLNGLVVAAIFVTCGLFYLGVTPRTALARLKKRRRGG